MKPTDERIKLLEKKIRKLRKALRFYADPMTYFAIAFIPDHPCGDFLDDFEDDCPSLGSIDLRGKPGKRARAALARTKIANGE